VSASAAIVGASTVAILMGSRRSLPVRSAPRVPCRTRCCGPLAPADALNRVLPEVVQVHRDVMRRVRWASCTDRRVRRGWRVAWGRSRPEVQGAGMSTAPAPALLQGTGKVRTDNGQGLLRSHHHDRVGAAAPLPTVNVPLKPRNDDGTCGDTSMTRVPAVVRCPLTAGRAP
jgi:hypothetical protein